MATVKPELELMCEIWSAGGWHYEVGPDRDGLGMLEIRYYDEKDTMSKHRLSFPKEDAKVVAEAMLKLLSLEGSQ